MASAPGRPSSTPTPTAASARMCGSSPTATTSVGCGCTRPGWRAGMPPATPTATPADHDPLGPPCRRAGTGPAAAAARRRRAPPGRGHRPGEGGGRPRQADPTEEEAVITPDEEHLLKDT